MSGGITGAANAARSAWQALYEVNPLFLVGGSFANFPGGIYPFSGLAGALLGVVQGALGSGQPFLGEWLVMPGGKMISQSVAIYPYASQQVAANATVQEPLTLSMLLRAPVKDGFGYLTKSAILTSLKVALTAHNNAGGTYTVFTPGLLYQNGLLLDVFDATAGETKQVQVDWQFDFFFPLITKQAATAAFSSAMAKIAGRQPVTGAPSWAALSVGL
jgi:hypothetical protein